MTDKLLLTINYMKINYTFGCRLVDRILNYWVTLIFNKNDDFVVILLFTK